MMSVGSIRRSWSATYESERSRLFLAAAYLLLIITSYTTTKALRDSFFILAVGPSQLPLLYVITALSMAAISLVYPRALARAGVYRVTRVTSLTAIVSLLVFWRLVGVGGTASLYVLYVWVSLFGAIAVSQAWSLSNQIFDAREARRSFAWIGVGGIVGGIFGGALAGVIAPWLGAEALFPICAALVMLTMLIARQLWAKSPLAPGPAKPADSVSGKSASIATDASAAKPTGFGWIRESPYTVLLAGLLMVGVVVEAFVDYQFKATAYQFLDSKDRLTSFFGSIASFGGICALLVQMLLTNRLLRRFGAGAAIVMLPGALMAGFVLVAARPSLWAVSILKLADGALSYSVHRSGMELLYMPIPPRIRASAKALMDMLVDRGGRAIGGVLLMLLTAGLGLSLPSLCLVAVAGLTGWLALAAAVRRSYVNAFRTALAKTVIEPEGLDIERVDRTTRRALVEALSSADERQALYALDLLSKGPVSPWLRQLPALMEHQSPTVRSRVISMLTDNNAYCPEYVELRLTDTDCEVRTEAVRHLCQTGPAGPRETLKRCFISVNPKIVFAGLRCLTEYYPEEVDLVGEPLIERVLNAEVDSVGARAAAARALGMARLPSATRFLDRLLRDPNEEVVREAIRSSSQIVHEGAIPLLIAMLSVSALRRDAREALVKFGPLAMTELKARLYDDDVSTSVRARIPKVCSLMLRQEVADFLLESVHRLNPQLDAPLVKALNRMRTRSRDIVFDSERVSALIREECEKHGRLGAIRRSIRFNEHNDEKEGPSQADDLAALLEKAIVERQQENVETILRLLHLIYSPTDIRSVHFSVNARPENRASAVEFLDNLIEPALRELVVPVIEEDNQDPEHWRDAERGASLDEALSALITGNDEWLRAIAEELVERRTPANVLSVA